MKSNTQTFSPFHQAGDTTEQLVLTELKYILQAGYHIIFSCIDGSCSQTTSCYFMAGVKLNPVIRKGRGWIFCQLVQIASGALVVVFCVVTINRIRNAFCWSLASAALWHCFRALDQSGRWPLIKDRNASSCTCHPPIRLNQILSGSMRGRCSGGLAINLEGAHFCQQTED